MAMGRQRDRQGEMLLSWDELPKSPGHVFYDRLQEGLLESGFDGFVEGLCKPYYAPVMGARSLPPGRYFRMVDATRRRSGPSRASTASAGSSGAAPTACR
jgi:transposase